MKTVPIIVIDGTLIGGWQNLEALYRKGQLMNLKTWTKEEIAALLYKNVVTVTFEKDNGEIRVMQATLMREHLPPIEEKKTNTAKAPDNVQRCWDMEKKAWRSFRVDRVRDVRI